ncbi:hypothetical protein [Actinophytocola algeriensis]|uniref:YbaB/EbfC DNA-binding family protein n=1 Tax=Actinophytocola algeriensis TaxID=1768010 RepID=A0A7W7VC87_9PSEU|nr:hypothetical protein [Actinophytocola algeriensis]MBB4904801.1 hypothetical protein [Actinophytocola algeriensis]MBE1476340.1 hypothetical protein [Actinophytocola algeriensis]
MNDLSVDELIELSTRSTPEVFATLSAITATATGDGITATVNLEGRLVALDLEPHVLSAGPDRLAAEIYRLVQDASATALNTGIEILAPAAGEELAAELRALVLPAPAKPVRPSPAAEDDFSTVETWAVPR